PGTASTRTSSTRAMPMTWSSWWMLSRVMTGCSGQWISGCGRNSPKLHVQINEEKSRVVDLGKGESFGFLGFEFRRVRSRKGAWRPRYAPKLKKRTALLQKLRDLFRRFQSQPVGRVVALINPILRGWVRYFAVGDASRCFGFVKDWVEKKVRRH